MSEIPEDVVELVAAHPNASRGLVLAFCQWMYEHYPFQTFGAMTRVEHGILWRRFFAQRGEVKEGEP